MSSFQSGPEVWLQPPQPPRPDLPEVRIDDDATPEPTPAVSEPPAPSTRVLRGSAPGLTAPGVVVVLLTLSVVGAIIDTTVGDDLGPCFAVLFVASALYAATQVRRPDLLAAVIAPPLVFLAVVAVHEILAPTSKSRALIDLMGDLVSSLALDAPTLWVGTVVAAITVFWRFRR